MPAIDGPTQAAACCSVEPPSSTAPLRPLIPSERSMASAKTTLAWPSEKKKPTLSGRRPASTIFLVTLSITAMWSASNACRAPSAYAVRPRAIP